MCLAIVSEQILEILNKLFLGRAFLCNIIGLEQYVYYIIWYKNGEIVCEIYITDLESFRLLVHKRLFVS
jgi:hypothetical protein